MKQDKVTEAKKREIKMERSKADTKKKRSLDRLNYPNQNTIIINIFFQYFIRYGKYNEIQLTKNKMNFNNRKIKNNPPSPAFNIRLEPHGSIN